jgi:hypothetical protein
MKIFGKKINRTEYGIAGLSLVIAGIITSSILTRPVTHKGIVQEGPYTGVKYELREEKIQDQ